MDAKQTERTRNLLCAAFEGGSNYWGYCIESATYPKGFKMEDFREGGKAQPKNPDGSENYHHWSTLIPTMGGSLKITCDDMDDAELNAASIQHGWAVMKEKYPRHWANAMDDDGSNGDAETGDAFLQCCLFGEIVFG